jgi:hypothetical protein
MACTRAAARAEVYCTVSRLEGSLKGWRAEAARRTRLRGALVSALLHWSHLSAAKAFAWWKEWALSRAALHRRARAYLAALTGREMAWAFCMLRCAGVEKLADVLLLLVCVAAGFAIEA